MLSRRGPVSVLVFIFLFSIFFSISSNARKKEAAYALTWNQFLMLDKKLKKKYMKEFLQVLRNLEENSKRKKTARLSNPIQMWMPYANALGPNSSVKTCLNLGHFRGIAKDKSCNFDVSNVVDQKEKISIWKKKNERCKPKELCNEAAFGPGICESEDNTQSCLDKSIAAGPGYGMNELLLVSGLCRPKLNAVDTFADANPEPDDCDNLAKRYDRLEAGVKKMCGKAAQRKATDSEKISCDRSRNVVTQIKKQFEGQGRGRLVAPASERHCSLIGQPVIGESAIRCNGTFKTEMICTMAVQSCRSKRGFPARNDEPSSVTCPTIKRGPKNFCPGPQRCIDTGATIFSLKPAKIISEEGESPSEKSPTSNVTGSREVI